MGSRLSMLAGAGRISVSPGFAADEVEGDAATSGGTASTARAKRCLLR